MAATFPPINQAALIKPYVYNFDYSKLLKLQAGIAKVRAGVGNRSILFMGTSQNLGYGTNVTPGLMRMGGVSNQLAPFLNGLGLNAQSQGFFGFGNTHGTASQSPQFDNRVSLGGFYVNSVTSFGGSMAAQTRADNAGSNGASITGTLTNGSNVITAVSNVNSIAIGQTIQSATAGIAAAATVTASNGTNTLTMSANFTGTTTVGATITSDNTAALTFTPTVSVDSFDIYYYAGGAAASFSWQVDAGTVNTVAQSGSGMKRLTVSAGTLAAHTLKLKWVSGSTLWVLGFDAYDSTKKWLSLINAGWVGGFASDVNPTASGWQPLQAISVMSTGGFAPDLIVLEYGTNEWNNAVSVATYTANMQSLITGFASYADVILFGGASSNPVTKSSLATQQQYIDALVGLSNSNGVPMIDTWRRWGGTFATPNTLGLMYDDVHPNLPGHCLWAGACNDVIGAF